MNCDKLAKFVVCAREDRDVSTAIRMTTEEGECAGPAHADTWPILSLSCLRARKCHDRRPKLSFAMKDCSSGPDRGSSGFLSHRLGSTMALVSPRSAMCAM